MVSKPSIVMRRYSLLVSLILGISLPAFSSAQGSNEWLISLKREITRLAIDERAYLHSIARVRNSVVGDEDLFFISDVNLEELDIRLLPDGNVSVARPKGDSFLASEEGIAAISGGQESARQCSKEAKNLSKLSLVFRNPRTSQYSVSSQTANSLMYMQKFVNGVLANEKKFSFSPYSEGVSQYDNLLQGNGFSKFKHKLVVSVEHEKSLKKRVFSLSNLKSLLSAPYQMHEIFVELKLLEGNVTIEQMRERVSLVETVTEGLEGLELKLRPNSQGALDILESSIIKFLSDAKCLIKHSNVAVVREGKLILDAGINAGYAAGDQLLLMPKSPYLKKRGLLSGVEQIAIVRISKIDDLRSLLEIEEGDVRIESGVEFTVKPLLGLI